MERPEPTTKTGRINPPKGWPHIIFGCSVLAFFGGGIWTGSETLFTHDLGFSDHWHFHVPLKKLYAEALEAGGIPWWNHLLSTGFPLVAEGQVGALYPPHLVLFSLFGFIQAMGLALALHLVWGSSGVFMLCRHWGYSTGAAFISGVLFSTCGFMVVHAKHLNMIEAAAWLPWVMYEVRRLAKGDSSGARLALALAMSSLCGHPQITYYSLLVGLVVGLFSLPWSMGWQQCKSPLLRAALAISTAALLSAPQLLATAELAELSPRSEGLSDDEMTQWSYAPEFLSLFLAPDAYGDPAILVEDEDGKLQGFAPPDGTEAFYWEVNGYMGLIPWMLLFFLMLRPERKRALPFIGLLVGGLLMLLSPSLGLGETVSSMLPGYDLFRFHSRWLLIVNLALAMLSAAGVDALIAWLPDNQRRWSPMLIGILALVAWSDSHLALGHHNPSIETNTWLEKPSSVLEIEKTSTENGLFRVVVQDPGDRSFLSAYAAAKGWSGSLEPYREVRSVIRPNLGALYDINTLFYYFHLAPNRLKSGIETTLMGGGQIHPGHAGRMNVGFLVAAAPRLGNETQNCLGGGPASCVQVLPNPQLQPRYQLASFAHVVPPGPGAVDQARALLMGPQFNLARDVVLEGPGILAETNNTAPLEGTVRLDAYEHHRVELTVRSSRPAWLVTSDTWYPGWEAIVDGKATPIYPANISGRAVLIPAGTHAVRFNYRPTTYTTGWFLFALGFLVLTGLTWIRRPTD